MKGFFKKITAAALGLVMTATAAAGGAVSTYAADTVEHTKTIEGSGDSYTLKLNVTGKDKKDESTSTTTTNGHADVLLVLDVTSSMSNTMSDGKTRLSAVQSAATQFVSGLNDDASSNIALITWGLTSNSGNTPIWTNQDWTGVSAASKASLNNTINGLTLHNDNYSYDTTYAPVLNEAATLLDSSKVSSDGNNKYVIFFSDGDASDSQTTIATAANKIKTNATVFTVGLPATYWYQSTDKIESVATDSSKYYEVSNVNDMISAFNGALETIKTETKVSSTPMTNVTINDVLSQYVELNGDISVSGNSGNVTAQSVNGKSISVSLDKLPEGETVTLSIPVKPSQAAKDAADAAGDTDSTFATNDSATLSYSYDGDVQEVAYAETPQITLKGTKQDDKPVQQSDISFDLVKNLEVKAGDKVVPDAAFKFSAETTVANAPAISIDDVTFTSADTLDSDNKASKSVSFTLPAASEFPAEGTYEYVISEVPDTYDGDGFMTYDSESYKLSVKVCETAEGLTYDDGNGTHITLAKASDGSKVEKLEFNNEYDKDVESTALTVSKTVAGEHANKNLEFEYTISFTDPGNAKDVTPAINGEAIQYGEDYTFKLKDGEKAEFTLPVGTKYTIVEKGTDSYEAKCIVTTGDIQDTKSAGVGAELTVSDVTAVKGENKADFTNTYVDNPLTGITNGRGPILIIIPAAIAAAVLLFVEKRRRMARK